MLKVNNLSKNFGSTNAIEDVSLDINEGEFIVFVGPSGCGKTTLLRLIAGLEKPTKGSVFFDNIEIKSPSPERGVVFQDFALFPWLTIFENIAFGLRIKKLSEEVIIQIVQRYLKLIGLNQFKNKYPHVLSGGMQQRVAIARTLANNPKILLLDEPFGSLDVQTRSQMQEFLAKLWDEEKKTTIMVTHDIDEAIYLADRVVILSTKPGTIKEIINVNLPRPRRPEIRFSDEYLKLKKHIDYIIRSESIKASLENNQSAEENILKFGVNIWPGIAPFYYAKDIGLLSQGKKDIELISLEKDDNRIKKYQENKIDILTLTLDTAILLADKIDDLRVLMVYNRSFGGDALVVNSSIKSIQDLKNKKIGLEKGWVSHFFLLFLLDKFGLSSEDVEIVDFKGSDIGGGIISGKIDAGVLWEPWLSKTKELTNVRTLATTKDFPVVYDVLVVKNSVYQKRKQEFDDLTHIWQHALKMFSEQKSEAIKIVATYFGISETELSEQLDGLQFLNSNPNNILEIIKEIESVLLKEKLIKKPVKLII